MSLNVFRFSDLICSVLFFYLHLSVTSQTFHISFPSLSNLSTSFSEYPHLLKYSSFPFPHLVHRHLSSSSFPSCQHSFTNILYSPSLIPVFLKSILILSLYFLSYCTYCVDVFLSTLIINLKYSL